MTVKILFFGDVMGRPGREAIAQVLPKWREECQPDFVIANVENLAHGFGITENSIQELKDAGVDLCTSGNHIWDRQPQGDKILGETDPYVLRPYNYDDSRSGIGIKTLEIGAKSVTVINLQGQVFMPHTVSDPFESLENALSTHGSMSNVVFVDFHAEATSEKSAVARAFDGKISALIGTHTHVATADARILKNGTAFQSDAGMTGPRESVIGMDEAAVLKRFRSEGKGHFEPAAGPVEIHATLVTVNADGKACDIKTFQDIIE